MSGHGSLSSVDMKLDNRESGDENVLVRPLSPRPLPLSDLQAMAEMDVEGNTPFDLQNVRVLLLAHAGGLVAHTHYALVKSSRLAMEQNPAPWLENRRIRHGTEQLRVSSWSVSAVTGNGSKAVLVCAESVLLLAALTFGHALWQLGSARASTDLAIAELRPRVVAFRAAQAAKAKGVEAAEAIVNARIRTPQHGQLVETLTRLLPDSAHLTMLEISGKTVRLAGFARNAAGLISVLERSAAFENVTFENPVLRIPGPPVLDRFSIALVMQ